MSKPIETWEQLKDAAEREATVLLCGVGERSDLYSVGRCYLALGGVGIRVTTDIILLNDASHRKGNLWVYGSQLTLTEMDDA